jgi:DNA replication and repair protein RecF
VILTRLATENFRNLEPAEQTFHPSANIIVGRNGQGKTNLLEAIYFLATTKSFRTTRPASLPRFGTSNLFVRGAVRREGLEKALSAGLETGEAKRRVLMVNGERVSLPAYLQELTVFAYSSARLEILRGAPEERRRFLDRGVASIHPGYLEELSRYTRVLKQRNALLYEIGTGNANVRSLDAWDETFINAATAVQTARAAYAEELAEVFRRIVAEHGYHVSSMEMVYRPSVGDWRALRREEVRAKMSLSGPQRDLLEFTLEGRPAAEVLSGGELKTIVLFLKFAKLELFRRRFDQPPLFLLDDIDAELDLEILQQLLAKLPLETQVFATSAKEAFLQALRAGPHLRLTVDRGRVTTTREFA